MKRAAVFLFLLLCVAGLALLLLENTGERAERRHAAAPEAAGRAPGEAHEGGGDDATRAEAGSTRGARDDDPNRVDGPDLVLRGRVLLDGKGVPDATVAALRAAPAYLPTWLTYYTRDFGDPPAPLATARTGQGGVFEVSVARRSRLFVRATRPGSGYASLFLLMPETGDPPDIVLELREPCPLEGLVVDGKETPVAGASVAVSVTDYRRARTELLAQTVTTDAAGRFAVPDLPAGAYRLRTTAQGYPLASSYVTLPAQAYVRIQLVPGGTVAGRVTLPDGTGVAGANLVIYTSPVAGGSPGIGETVTEESGAYRVEVVPGAVNTIVVEHPRYGRHTTSGTTMGTLRAPTAIVEAGKELHHDIELTPGVPLRGRAVMAGTDAPAPLARITLLALQTSWRNLRVVDVVQADPQGRFEFPYVTEGTYGFEAATKDAARLAVRQAQGGQPLTVDVFVDGEHAPPEQTLELEPAGTVRGRMTGADLAGEVYRRPNVFIQNATGNLNAALDDAGAFLFPAVPVMEQAFVESYNPQAKSDPFAVEAGRTTEIEIDLTQRGGVTGIVEDEGGEPIAGATVAMMPEGQARQMMQQFVQYGGRGSVHTDKDGRFALGLGNWSHEYYRTMSFIAAANAPDRTVSMSPSFMLPKEGETRELRLVLRSGGTVSGHVEFQGGGPAVGILVTLEPVADKNAPFELRSPIRTYTDFDGRFTAPGVGEGAYQASARHPEGKVEAVEARAGDEDVRLVIAPALAIEGLVLTEAGEPVVRAQVSARTMSGPAGATSTGQSGRFRLGQLDEGAYTLEVAPQRQGYGVADGFEKQEIEGIEAGRTGLVITVSDGPVLRGRVLGPAGKGVAGAVVIALPLTAAKPQDREAYQQQQQAQRPAAFTSGRGEFELKGVGTEEVEVLVIGEGYMPATQRARAGGAPLTLRVEQGGAVEGRIFRPDGTPLANQYISLMAATPEVGARLQDWQTRAGQTWGYLGGWYTTTARTDGKGEFRLSSLMPGEYRLSLTLEDGVLGATTLRTGAGPVTLHLEPPLSIRGRVTDLDGRPIPVDGNNRVWINARQGNQYLPGTSADADGYFEIKGLPAGTMTLQVWGGRGFKSVRVEAQAGEDSLRIRLEPNEPTPKK